jgi:hypothetical protein
MYGNFGLASRLSNILMLYVCILANTVHTATPMGHTHTSTKQSRKLAAYSANICRPELTRKRGTKFKYLQIFRLNKYTVWEI